MELYLSRTILVSIALVVILFSYALCHTKERTKRTLAFTDGNSQGYLAAVAIPIDLANRDLFVAFNLETNYGLPPNDSHYGIINKWDLHGMFGGAGNDVTHIEGGRKQRSLKTRTNFYTCIADYLNIFGYNGTECLLRTVCEVTESNIYASSGVFGSIFQILMKPTSSADENIPLDLYIAEERGLQNKCQGYKSGCPEGLLDKISTVL